MINIYTYDGSFEGFLSCIYQSYYSSDKPDDIVYFEDYIPNLLHKVINIDTSEESSKVLIAIKEKIGNEALRNVFTVYLSEEPGFEMLLHDYIKLGFRLGREIHNHLHNETVLKIIKICSKVIFECHRMCGFVRFKCINEELYYSAIEPDHNILTILAPHFAERFSSQKWIIHDVKRSIAAMYNGEHWVLSPLEKEVSKKLLSNTDNFETLWKTYYVTVAIEERINPKLQKRLMPKRYWKYIIETK